LFSFIAGEPFIVSENLDAKLRLQAAGKSLNVTRGITLSAVHSERQANDDRFGFTSGRADLAGEVVALGAGVAEAQVRVFPPPPPAVSLRQ
jgi:hypothetical protein